MSKLAVYVAMACILGSIVAPAYAGAVSKQPLTEAEDAGLTAQQTQDADGLAQVSGGDGVILVLAVVGVVFIVLAVTGVVN